MSKCTLLALSMMIVGCSSSGGSDTGTKSPYITSANSSIAEVGL